jgi:plasmid maintenance system antidote protein VapI
MAPAELKNELEKQGYSYHGFARKIGVTYKTVSCWVNGHHKIPTTIPVILNIKKTN